MIIAFTGQKFCGKDTAASAFDVPNLKFAAPIKDMVRALLIECSFVEDVERHIEGDLKEIPLKLAGVHRSVMARIMRNAFVSSLEGTSVEEVSGGKDLGFIDSTLTKAMRVLLSDPSLTTRRIMQYIGTEWGRQAVHPELWVNILIANARKHTNCIITDLRFLNEAKAIRDIGGYIVRITRPEFENTGVGDDHVSELEMNKIKVDDVWSNIYPSQEEWKIAVSKRINFS